LLEIILAAVLLAGGLAITAGAYHHVVTRARVGDTQVLLAGLGRATAALPEDVALSVLAAADDRHLLDALCADRQALAALQGVSPYLWKCAEGAATCVDAWGTPLRIITRSTADAAFDQRLQLAGGGAIYESAGPDRDFGDAGPARRMDNLRSDDPDLSVIE
jgi:hypothetical protein